MAARPRPPAIPGSRGLTIFLLIACGALTGLGLALLPALLSGATL